MSIQSKMIVGFSLFLSSLASVSLVCSSGHAATADWSALHEIPQGTLIRVKKALSQDWSRRTHLTAPEGETIRCFLDVRAEEGDVYIVGINEVAFSRNTPAVVSDLYDKYYEKGAVALPELDQVQFVREFFSRGSGYSVGVQMHKLVRSARGRESLMNSNQANLNCSSKTERMISKEALLNATKESIEILPVDPAFMDTWVAARRQMAEVDNQLIKAMQTWFRARFEIIDSLDGAIEKLKTAK